MRIGILTFYREINFGANIQALSTYGYLLKNGHSPIFINFCSEKKERQWGPMMDTMPQPNCHREFVDATLKQTEVCRNANDINDVIHKYGIEGILVGSDAVLQHHPLRDRLRFSHKKLINVIKSFPDTSFPNPFWGVGIDKNVKMALMSVSSQDSEYYHYPHNMQLSMKDALSRFSFISVRDTWTFNMIKTILGGDTGRNIMVTPDPVFNFNSNAGEYILNKDDILEKFKIPSRYVLISLFGQHLKMDTLNRLKMLFHDVGIACVALPMQLGYMFKHPFDYEIPVPLIPTDWYALIKYSSGYIGNNMHPVVVALHNAIPCFSIDFYGIRDFWGRPKKMNSSKIRHILEEFGVDSNYEVVVNGECSIAPDKIFKAIQSFPIDTVRRIAEIKSTQYGQMMDEIFSNWGKL